MRDRPTPEETALAARALRDPSNEELDEWCFACLRLSRLDRSWLGRWRWRRRWRRALRASMMRANARLGAGPELCQRCGLRRPTVHVLYGHGADERSGHFCAECSERAQRGWFGRSEGKRVAAGPDQQSRPPA